MRNRTPHPKRNTREQTVHRKNRQQGNRQQANRSNDSRRPSQNVATLKPIDATTKVRRKGNVYYLFHKNRRRVPWRIIVALLFVFAGAIGTAYTYAQIHSVQQEIDVYRRQLTTQTVNNRNLESQVTRNYTREEIERHASERLGMSAPDPSQIIYFHVPHQSGVLLSEYFPDEISAENHFWQGLVAFFRGIRERIF